MGKKSYFKNFEIIFSQAEIEHVRLSMKVHLPIT